MILHATDKDLIIKESERLISGSVNMYTCAFTFDESWEGYAKTVVFSTANRLINVALLDDTCEIPPEALRPNARVRIGIYGTDGVRSRPTTYSEWIPVEQGADVTGSYAEPPTPSVYDQWVDAINDKHDEWEANEQERIEAEAARAEAEQAREDLETGYVAQAKEHAEAAKAAEEASAASEINAKASEMAADTSAANAAQSTAIAKTAAENAMTWSVDASYSAAEAKASESAATAAQSAVENMSATSDLVPADSDLPVVEKTIGDDGSVNLHFNVRQGFSGVYVGSGPMPEWCNVQVDINGDPTDMGDIVDLALDVIPTYNGEVEDV